MIKLHNKIKMNQNEDKCAVGLSNKRTSFVQIDHWAFLDEIEAPMWVDLTLDPNMTAQDNDDAWFHTSHPFHRNSACQLRSAFSHPDAGNDFVNFNLQGACSPKLPSSVSKSRGKNYISKPRRNNDVISVSKNHPINDLGGRISTLDCKPKVNPENPSEVSSDYQSVCTSGVSTSTITTVSQREDSKLSTVSKEGFGQTGGLLNALKTNLRRSCATRPALRVEIRDDRELKGRKSSSGKSSVGSSNVGYDGKVKRLVILTKTDHLEQVKMVRNVHMKPKGQNSLTGKPSMEISNPILKDKRLAAGYKQNREKTFGGKRPENLVQPMKERTAYKNSDGPIKEVTVGVKQKEYKSSNIRDLGKSKVLISENVTNRSRLGGPGVKGRVGRAHLDGSSCFIKENIKRVALSRISSGNCNMPSVRTIDQKRSIKLSENKGSVASVGSKVKVKGVRLDDSKVVSSRARVYLR